MTEAAWTIDQLAARVDAALSVGYAGQPSARVREVPDPRAIRYYTTLGLLDRPAALRGRTALYGRRHLLQLVAVKRLQAEGRSLAEVQAELAGASDRRLARIARLPAEPAADGPAAAAPAAREGFWRHPAARPVRPRAAAAALAAPSGAPAAAAGGTLHGVRLGEGVVLLVEGAPLEGADLDAVLAAAGPLLEALRARRPPGATSRRERP